MKAVRCTALPFTHPNRAIQLYSLDNYRVVDVAMKVVGVSSFSTRCGIALLVTGVMILYSYKAD